jgi:hypothetical protein
MEYFVFKTVRSVERSMLPVEVFIRYTYLKLSTRLLINLEYGITRRVVDIIFFIAASNVQQNVAMKLIA